MKPHEAYQNTYARNALKTELAGRRERQNAYIARTSAQFTAETAARTDKRGNYKAMKYERASFTVVTASEAYREGYEAIDWSRTNTGTEEASARVPGPSGVRGET